MISRYELPPEELRRTCRPEEFRFRTTAELPTPEGFIDQERALSALRFGISAPFRGYNIYAAGITGTGRTTIVRRLVGEIAAGQQTPDDWVYVHNFASPDRPNAIRLPAGRGRELERRMEALVEELRRQLPQAFESASYEDQKGQLMEGLQKRRAEALLALEREAAERSFQIRSTPSGLITIPLLDGQPVDSDRYETLSEGIRAEIRARQEVLNHRIRETIRGVRVMEKEVREQVDRLNREVALVSVGPLIAELKEAFADVAEVPQYLDRVQADILENLDEFAGEKEEKASPLEEAVGAPATPFLRHRVNLLVDNSATRGAPVIFETNPTYVNLVGQIERRAQLGALYTDFTMIKAGSILRANGGYLILNAADVLHGPYSWEALKRCLKNCEVKIEDLGEHYGLFATTGVKPEPIPISIKVIMIGSAWLHQYLHAVDEDFRKIFKVKADFDYQMDRTPGNLERYASFIGRMVRDEGLPPFDAGAVGAVVEHGARLVEDREKVSLRFGDIADIVREAGHWAREEGSEAVKADHVRRAIREKVHRANLLEEKIQELIAEGTLMVDAEGAAVGQVNGLSIYDLGDFNFGKPVRITAQLYAGRDGVVNIERRARLSGRTHDKGVLILTGYLSGRFARERPLSLSASLAFEQTYEEIDGDSASSTELYAILSQLADLPIHQGIAVTGSVNQKGEIQPIGGVNRKIEGFFDVCRLKGLTGEQGVIIPVQNVRNLMLREDVVEAVREGQFHLYAVRTVDEGIGVLTGVPAGEAGADGHYPEGTVNAAIARRLEEMSKPPREKPAPPRRRAGLFPHRTRRRAARPREAPAGRRRRTPRRGR